MQTVRGHKSSHLFENPSVNRVNRRICNLIVRFWRSTILVQIRAGSGLPRTGTTSVEATSAGL